MVNRRRITLTMVSRFCYWSLREGRNLESWNNGMLEFWVRSIHQCIIPLLQDSSKEVTHGWSSARLARDRLYSSFERTLLHDAAWTPGSGDHQDRAAKRRSLSPIMDASGCQKGWLRVFVDQR